MDFQEGVRARLLAAPAVAAVVADYTPPGSAPTKAIFWVTRPPKSALPAITLQTISDPRSQHLKGFDGARATRIQMDVWASRYAEAMAGARAAIAALAAPETVSGKIFGNAVVDGQSDLGETVADGSFVHRQSVDLLIWHVGD